MEIRKLSEDFFKHYMTVHIVRRRLGEPLDYSPAIYRMLTVLGAQQPCSLKRLCRILGISTSTGSILVEKMVKQGFLERVQNEVDRRKIVLRLTQEGEMVLNRDLDAQLARFDEAFGILSQKDQKVLLDAIHTADMILEKIEMEPENI